MNNFYTGGTVVQAGELHVLGNGGLGNVAAPVNVEPAGALTFTTSTTTGRTFTLSDGSLGVAAGQTLTFANARVFGGFLVGPGSFATQSGTTNTFVGNTASTLTNLSLASADSLTNFTNGGTITKSTGSTATLTRFTNTFSGQMTVAGTIQASEFVSSGQINISVGLVNNTASNLVLGGGSKTFVGTVANPGGTITMMGGTTIELNGGLLVNNGTINGTVNVNFGSLAKGSGLYGVVNVNQGGIYAPGNSPGISTAAAVNFDNTLTTSGAPILMMELGGTALGTGYDRLNVTGQLSLGGNLQVVLVGGFSPQLNDEFDILNWGTRSGTFSTIQLPTLGSTLAWSPHRLYTDGILKVVNINLLPGDFNRDQQVTAADIPAMLKALTDLDAYSLTRTLNPAQLALIGDFNNSGNVSNQDLQGLLNLVANLGGGSVTSVPEPSSIILLAAALPASILFLRCRRVNC